MAGLVLAAHTVKCRALTDHHLSQRCCAYGAGLTLTPVDEEFLPEVSWAAIAAVKVA